MSNNKENIPHNNMIDSSNDPNWIIYSDESLLFDENLVLFKYYENCDQNLFYDFDFLEDYDDFENIDDETFFLYCFSELSKEEHMDYLVGILRKYKMNMKKSCEELISSSSYHHNLFKKRLQLMKKYNTLSDSLKINIMENQKEIKNEEIIKDNRKSDVPVVVKLSVVMLFPLIKTLSMIHENESQLICSQTLDMMINILRTLPPLSMRNEPDECLDSYKDFISYLMESSDLNLDFSVKVKAIIALLILSVAIGKPSNIFRSINILFDILIKTNLSQNINISPILIQTDSLLKLDRIEFDVPLIKEIYDSPFQIEILKYMQYNSKHWTEKPSLSTDGDFIYILNNFGLYKIGTGLNRTIKGLIYKSNTEVKNTSMSSIACIGDTIYLLKRDKDQSLNEHIELLKLSTKDLSFKGNIFLKVNNCSNNLELIGNGEHLYLIDVNNFIIFRDSDFYSDKNDYRDEISYTDGIFGDYLVSDYSQKKFKDENNMILVQVYDPNVDHEYIDPINRFEIYLRISFHYIFYCTRKYFAVHSSNRYDEKSYITFYPLDGSSKVIKFKQDFKKLMPCYDIKNNIIWTFNPDFNSIQSWINQDLSHSNFNGSFMDSEGFFTPEYILKSVSNSNEISHHFFEDTIIKFLASLERLSKVHPSYKINNIADSHSKSIYECTDLFKLFIEMNDNSIEYLCLTLKNSLNYIRTFKNWNDKSVYIIIATLRILKVNIYETISNNIKISKHLLEDIKNILFEIILEANNGSNFQYYAQETATNILLVGFRIFYESPEEKLNIAINILKTDEDNPFLLKLIDALSKCKYNCENLTGISTVIPKDNMKIEYNNSNFLVFLKLLVKKSKNESFEFIKDTSIECSPYITPVSRALYSIQKKILFHKSLCSVLYEYTSFVISESISLIDDVNSLLQNTDNRFHRNIIERMSYSSLLRVVLQPLLTGISHGTHFCNLVFSKYITRVICDLVSKLDQFNSQFEEAKEVDRHYTYNLPFKKHKKLLLKTEDFVHNDGELSCIIDFPGSELVSIKLKSSPKQNLQLFISGRDDIKLKFNSSNWPDKQFLIYGSRIKFSLITDKKDVDFKCYVSDIQTTNSDCNPYLWLLELESISANVGCSFAETLSIGRNIYAKCKSTLVCSEDYYKILKGGLRTNENDDDNEFLINFINNTDETKNLYQWIKMNRFITFHKKSNELIESTERKILACIFKHSGLVNECIEIVSILNNNESVLSLELRRKYSFIYHKITNLIASLIRKSEIIKDWLILVRERNYSKDVLESFQVDSQRFKDLCELLKIEYEEDMNVALEILSNKLKEDIEEYDENLSKDKNFELPDPYNSIFQPISEKAEFLLKLLPAFSFEPKDYSTTYLRSVICNYGSWDPSCINEDTYEESPIRDILSFITSNIDLNDLEHDLQLYQSVPENRALGFDYFSYLLNSCSFNFVRHYILIILNNHLISNSHYLDLLEFSGKNSYDIVKDSYYNYFKNLVSIMKNMKDDPISTLNTFQMCITGHQSFDSQLLYESKILSTLREIVINAHNLSKTENELCIQKQYEKVRDASWNTIKIIIINCLSWKYVVNIDKFPDVKRLFEDIFDILCEELKRLLKTIDRIEYKNDFILNNDICYDILFLLHKVIKQFDFQEKIDPSIFISIFNKNIYQKTKRLSIYLLNMISKYHINFFNEDVVEGILIELGKTLLEGIIMNQYEKEKINFNISLKDHNNNEEYEVYLLNLPHIAREKLIKSKTLSLRCHIEKIIKDFQKYGITIIYKGTFNECESIARDIVKYGCSVKIMKSPSIIDLNENRNEIYWVNGYSSYTIASEFIHFFNQLFNLPNFPSNLLNSILSKYIENIPSIIDSCITNEYDKMIINVYEVCGILSILSSFIEPIKVGSRVQINSQYFGENERGIVYSISDIVDIVEVYLENDKLRSLHLFSINEVKPLKDYNIDQERIKPLMRSLISSICYILKNLSHEMNSYSHCLFNFIQSHCLKLLYKITETIDDISLILESPLKEYLSILIEKAKSIDTMNNLQEIEHSILDLSTKLWNLQTKPEIIEVNKNELSILPYSVLKAKSDELYPYSLDISKSVGVVYNEDELIIEKLTDNDRNQSRQSYRRDNRNGRFDSNTESAVYANTIIPNKGGLFYFEVKIEKFNSSSPIAIGLSKYGSECWKSGCYMFTENKKIISIDMSNRTIINDYGEYFQTKSVIGCGWNQSEKTIFFTKDGVHLGTAFENVYSNNEQVIPTFVIGRNNIISVNFGKTPFKFNITSWNENINQLKLMGFSSTIVKQALRLTNNNVESAILWLIEHKNIDSSNTVIIIDDDDDDKSNNNDIKSLPESHYDLTLSSLYTLKNCYSFQTKKKYYSKHKSFGKIDLPNDLESQILPDIRSELLLDDDDPIFISQALNKIIKSYMNGGAKEANNFIKRLMGEGFKKISNEQGIIKNTSLRIGMYVIVSGVLKESLPNEKLSPSMERTIGRIGRVKDVDFTRNYVLLEFYNHETTLLEYYWYPISFISKSPRKNESKLRLKDDIMNDLIFSFQRLSNTYCRRIILQLMRHSDLTIGYEDSYISFENALLVSASEFLSSPKIISTSNSLIFDSDINKCENNLGMELIASRILSSMSRFRFNPILMNKFTENLLSILKKLLENNFKSTKTKLSWKNSEHHFKFNNSSALSILFEPLSSPYSHNIEIKSGKLEDIVYKYVSHDILYPLVLPSNSFTIKLKGNITESPPVGISILPMNYWLSLSKWLTEFLMEHSIDDFSNVSDIYNLLLDFIYHQESPNHIKESMINLFNRFIQLLRQYGRRGIQHLNSLPIHRMSKLIREVQTLYHKESNGLFSTYFQSLLEAIVSVMMFQEEERFRNKKSSSHDKVSKKDNDKNIALALSLAKSLKEELDEYNKSSTENRYDNESIIDNELSHEDSDIVTEFMMTLENLSFDPSEDIRDHSNDISSRNKSKMKAGVNQEWILQYLRCCQFLEFFCSRSASNTVQNIILSERIKTAWKKTKEDTLKANIILIEDLPTVKSEYRDSIIMTITDYLDDLSISYFHNSIWIPTVYDMTLSYMFIEIVSDSKLRVLTTNSHKIKFNIPSVGNFSANVVMKSLGLDKFHPKKRSKVMVNSPRKEIDLDERFASYLKSKLVNHESGGITKEFEEVLREIFVEYSVDNTEEGVLDKDQLDLLFINSLGDKVNDNLSSNILNTWKTKRYKYFLTKKPFIGMSMDHFKSINSLSSNHYYEELESVGLTLNGFIQYYETQAILQPILVWEELFNLGYDIHLTKNHFIDVNDAIESILNNPLFNTKRTDEELILYTEQLFNDMNLDHITMMNSCSILPLKHNSHLIQRYPRLSKLSLPTLRLRFEILRQFNILLGSVLPFINLEGDGIIAQQLSYCRGLIFLQVKMDFFFKVIDKTSYDVSRIPKVTINRLESAHSSEKSKSISRIDDFIDTTIFGTSFKYLHRVHPSRLRNKDSAGAWPKICFKVRYKGENVDGESGPYKQFFSDISKELRTVLPLFIPCPNAQAKVGMNRDKFIVCPSFKSVKSHQMYRFLGQLMGIAIRSGVLLSIDLPSFFWKPLVNQELTIQDLKDIDYSFCKFLEYISSCSKEELEGERRIIFEKFEVNLSDKTKVPLKKGGENIDLMYSNREEYRHLAERVRLNEHSSQMKSIKQGLHDIIPESLFRLFSWRDLELKVCGKPYIDINLLKRHTEYQSCSPQDYHIKLFWKVLRSFSQQDKRAFIRFVSAQERLPLSDEDFIRTKTKMIIKYHEMRDPDKSFPKAYTCFFNLMLPKYSSEEIMREKLLFAIHTDSDSLNGDERMIEIEDNTDLYETISRISNNFILYD